MKDEKLFKVVCPSCEATIWINAQTGGVIKSEKTAKKKSSLDDLLLREREKAEGMDHKLEATFELQKKKLEQAKEKFKSAWTHVKDKD